MTWVIRIVAGLAILIAVATAGVFLIPKDRVMAVALEQLRQATGRDVQVKGVGQMTLWPSLGVRTGAVTVSNAPWGTQTPLFQADALDVSLDLMALISGDVQIRRVAAVAPRLALETNADGQYNWQFAPIGASPSTEGSSPHARARKITVEEIEVEDAVISFAAPDRPIERVQGIDLWFEQEAGTGSAELTLSGRLSEDAITLTADISAFEALQARQPSDVALNLRTKGGSATFDGRLAATGDVAGRAALDINNIGTVLAALGLASDILPASLGPEIAGDVQLAVRPSFVSLQDLTLAAGQNQVSGDLEIDLQGKPKITGKLSSTGLDLGPAMSSGGATTGNSRTHADSGRIDASVLHLVDAEFAFDLASLKVPQTALGRVSGDVALENGRAVLRIEQAEAFDGTLSGDLVANARDGFSASADLKANGLSLASITRDLMGQASVSGRLNGAVDVLASGETSQALMRSAEGTGRLAIGSGTVGGIDLLAIMQGSAPGSGTTVFESITASFALRNGSLFNKDLLLKHELYQAKGAGRIGYVARDLDYRVTPVFFGELDALGLAIPVLIRGSWSAPLVIPDVEQALRNPITKGLDNAATQILGGTAEDAEAIGNALGQEVMRGLRGLLGGN